jgi:hypothetical protein
MNKPNSGKGLAARPKAPAGFVQPVHFEDFAGSQFERLVFAYHARTDRWLSLEWLGQTGKDKGRDILGVREVDGQKDGETVCILCANWQKLSLTKVKSDIDKVVKPPAHKPDRIRVVCGHDIPAGLRDKAKKHAESKGIYKCDLWSGKEFEEFIRTHAESLLLRFVQGEPFPDTANDLLLFAWGSVPIDDTERLSLISLAFDRPAFSTPIGQESSLPAFRKAIDDTIQVLQTGIWQTRGNVVIRRLPMASDVTDTVARDALLTTSKKLVALRKLFDSLVRSGAIEHCKCSDPDCPSYMMKDGAAQDLACAREQVLSSFRCACPTFKPSTD